MNEGMTSAAAANNWSEYRRLVVQSLKDMDSDIRVLDDEIDKMQLRFVVDITTLKVKAGIWGGVVGAIVGAAISGAVSTIIVHALTGH